MKARGVGGFGRHEAEAAHQLRSGHDANEQPIAAEAFAFARGEHRRHNHGAPMHRTSFERVVKILAVSGGSVDKGGAKRIESAAMTERSAGAPIVDACEGGGNVV